MSAGLFDLTDRVALVTGAAQGLGRAIALGLADQGAVVAVVDRDGEGAQAAVNSIIDRGGRAAAYTCDMACEAAICGTVAQVLEKHGQIDVLVSNAGITKRIPLMEWQAADWEEVIRVNQLGTFLLGREVGRHMAARRRGSIVHVAALGGGVVGLGRGNAIYCSTKGAVVALMREFAAEWASAGVRVNAIAPGWFETQMNAPLLKHAEFLDRIIERVPLGRLGVPEDVVGAVVFLASDASAYITGQLLPIDGGVASIVRLSEAAVVR